jgi:hypothetical protein
MDFLLYELGSSLTYIIGGLGTVIVIVIIAAVVSNFKKGSNPVLILQEFNFNEHEDVFLAIKGRASGFWNWVLSLFNKAPITGFTCSKRLLKYEASKIKYYIPMIKISCVSSAFVYKLRIILLILGIILIAASLAAPSFVVETAIRITLVIVGITLFLCSFLKKKTIHFGIYINENKPMLTLTLKKGIINSIEKETFEAAANTLTRIVLANAIAK